MKTIIVIITIIIIVVLVVILLGKFCDRRYVCLFSKANK